MATGDLHILWDGSILQETDEGHVPAETVSVPTQDGTSTYDGIPQVRVLDIRVRNGSVSVDDLQAVAKVLSQRMQINNGQYMNRSGAPNGVACARLSMADSV